MHTDPSCCPTESGVNGGHIDEYDYLFVGKTLLSGGQWPTHSYIFGWDYNWRLLAWGENEFGGMQGARFIAAIVGAFSLLGMYAFVYNLWYRHNIALVATLLLSFEGAHLYTSALATYDIISFTAFTFALPCVLLACQSNRAQLFWTILACVALSLSVLSKYTAIMYLPLLAVLVLWYSPRYALLGTLLITVALVVYTTINYEQLIILYEVQIQRTHSTNATLADIVNRTLRQLGVTIVLVGVALLYCISTGHTQTKKLVILVVFSLPLLLYHTTTQNIISLQKHLAYTSLFLIPIIAWLLLEIYTRGKQTHLSGAIVLACISVYAFVNVSHLRTMQSSYPDVRKVHTIADQIQPTDFVLSEDPYLFRYLLVGKVAQNQISETTWLDNNLDGKHERIDVKHAIWDRKFDYVFLNDQQHKEINTAMNLSTSPKAHTQVNQRCEPPHSNFPTIT